MQAPSRLEYGVSECVNVCPLAEHFCCPSFGHNASTELGKLIKLVETSAAHRGERLSKVELVARVSGETGHLLRAPP